MGKKLKLKAGMKKRATTKASRRKSPRASVAVFLSRKDAVRTALRRSSKQKSKRTSKALEPLPEGVFASQGLVFDYEAIDRAREHAHAAA